MSGRRKGEAGGWDVLQSRVAVRIETVQWQTECSPMGIAKRDSIQVLVAGHEKHSTA